MGGQIQVYGQAEVTHTTLIEKGATHGIAQNNQDFKGVTIAPAYDKNEKLVGYDVYDKNNPGLGHPILEIGSGDLGAFKAGYSNYVAGARHYYQNGEPSEGMKQLSAGVATGDFSMVSGGAGKLNSDAWHDPVFVASFAVSLGHAGLGFFEEPVNTKVAQTSISANTSPQLQQAVLAENNAAQALGNMEANSPGAHFFSRHGAQTTLAQQLERATTGLTPEGVVGRVSDASRFLSHQSQLQAVKQAEAIYQQSGKNSIVFSMGHTIGEGYLKGGNSVINTSNVQAIFKNGKLYTIYPKLR